MVKWILGTMITFIILTIIFWSKLNSNNPGDVTIAFAAIGFGALFWPIALCILLVVCLIKLIKK